MKIIRILKTLLKLLSKGELCCNRYRQ